MIYVHINIAKIKREIATFCSIVIYKKFDTKINEAPENHVSVACSKTMCNGRPCHIDLTAVLLANVHWKNIFTKL